MRGSDVREYQEHAAAFQANRRRASTPD
jgi:hypothetical protein